MDQPRIYLSVDNCFASKRWTRPSEWMPLIRDLGLSCIEASADNECDPFFSHPEYLDDWTREIKEWAERTRTRVVTFYSGHGTYATLGLSHTDPRVCDRMLNDWLVAMARRAGSLDAGMGFFTHAFPLSVLNDPARYHAACEALTGRLALLARAAHEHGVTTAGVEQMYTPHQVPWTVEGARHLLREVVRRAGTPFYVTIDTGHMTGQQRFLRPDTDALLKCLARMKQGAHESAFWVGPDPVRDAFVALVGRPECEWEDGVRRIQQGMDRFAYAFAAATDGDPYQWLRELGRYSPIIHLQQTDGRSSSHRPFNDEWNAKGIIDGPRVLRALAESYAKSRESGMPPPCTSLYLTLEVFSGTSDQPAEILERMRDSVAYWRRYIPADGLTLDELIRRLQ